MVDRLCVSSAVGGAGVRLCMNVATRVVAALRSASWNQAEAIGIEHMDLLGKGVRSSDRARRWRHLDRVVKCGVNFSRREAKRGRWSRWSRCKPAELRKTRRTVKVGVLPSSRLGSSAQDRWQIIQLVWCGFVRCETVSCCPLKEGPPLRGRLGVSCWLDLLGFRVK